MTEAIQAYSFPYMEMVSEGTRPREDLTARARIRDAALEQFAEHGFEGATIRGIAEAAGVSAGLVQHHFGTKEGLRRACDEAVLDLVRRKLEATKDGRISNPDVIGALYESGRPLVHYLSRAIVERSAATASLFDELADGTEAFLTTTWPDRFPPGSRRTRDAAAVLVAQSAGTMVLHQHLVRRMGLDRSNGVLSPRIGLAQLDVYEAIGEYVASDLGQQIREAANVYATESGEA